MPCHAGHERLRVRLARHRFSIAEVAVVARVGNILTPRATPPGAVLYRVAFRFASGLDLHETDQYEAVPTQS